MTQSADTLTIELPDLSSRDAYHAFLAERLSEKELAAVFQVVDALEADDIFKATQKHGQQACMALFAMVRAMASAAPSDASFMIGYEPMLLHPEKASEKTPEQQELEWWQDLMGFLFVGTFDGRWPDIREAIVFRNELLEYLWQFPRLLRPREEFWLRVTERQRAAHGFRPPSEQ